MKRLLPTLALVAVLASTAPAAVAEPHRSMSDALSTFTSQQLTWTDCNGEFQCATVSAPMDWSRPERATIQLALIRHRATGPTRLGSLLVNPGGPGGSGVDFVRDSLSSSVSSRLQEAFDIVGFDPRGVGHSTAVRCYNTA